MRGLTKYRPGSGPVQARPGPGLTAEKQPAGWVTKLADPLFTTDKAPRWHVQLWRWSIQTDVSSSLPGVYLSLNYTRGSSFKLKSGREAGEDGEWKTPGRVFKIW